MSPTLLQSPISNLGQIGPFVRLFWTFIYKVASFLKGNGQSLAKNPFFKTPWWTLPLSGGKRVICCCCTCKICPKTFYVYVQRVSSCIFSGFMQLIKVSYLERKGEKMVKKVSSYLEHYTSVWTQCDLFFLLKKRRKYSVLKSTFTNSL